MNLYITFDAVVKYQQVKKLESNYLSLILLQAVNGRGKKSNINAKQFTELLPIEYAKDTKIKLTGYFEENWFKQDDKWISTGLEFIADIITEVKEK